MAQELKMWHVYVLRDPRDEAIRYVGITSCLRKRISAHYRSKDNTPRSAWIRGLLSIGLKPSVEVVESGNTDHQAAERRWIAKFRADGCDLTNTTDGGNGTAGYVWTPEALAKIGAAAKGRRHTPEWIAKAAAAHRALNRKLSDEHRAIVSRAHKGVSYMTEDGRRRVSEWSRNRTITRETRDKLSVSSKGRVVAEDTRAKLAAAKRGKTHTPEARAKMSAHWKGRVFSAEHRAKLSEASKRRPRPPLRSHCKRGHPYDTANTYVGHNGRRFCRACHRDRERVYRAKKTKEVK